MKAGRFLPPLLVGASVLLLVCNVVPASTLKHKLQRERNELRRELEQERERARKLARQVHGLRNDPFVLERALVETWNATPEGAHAWSTPTRPAE